MNNESFRNKLKVDEPNDQQKVKLYEKFKSQQEAQFELYMNYINEVLCVLKHYRIVSDFTSFTARIKSTESALENDGIKTLDDVFGIEVDFATPGERAFVSEMIKETLNIKKERIHDKDNGYQAYHASGYPVEEIGLVENFEELLDKNVDPEKEMTNYYEALPKKRQEKAESRQDNILYYFNKFKEEFELYARAIRNRMNEEHFTQLKEDLASVEKEYIEKQKNEANGEKNNPNIPIIEFQSKTIQAAIEANIGTASHGIYKGTDSKKMQEEYDIINGKIPLSKVPTMYSSNLSVDENGKVIPPRVLSSDETLRRLYQDLITIGYKRKGEQIIK